MTELLLYLRLLTGCSHQQGSVSRSAYLVATLMSLDDGVPLPIPRPVLDGGVGDGAETGDAPVDLHRGIRGVGEGVKYDPDWSPHHLQSPGILTQAVGGHTLVQSDVLL